MATADTNGAKHMSGGKDASVHHMQCGQRYRAGTCAQNSSRLLPVAPPPPLRDALWPSWLHITCFAGSVLRSCNAHMQWRGYGCCTAASTVAIRCTLGLGTPCTCHPSTVLPRHLGTCSCKFQFVTREATRDVAWLATNLTLLL